MLWRDTIELIKETYTTSAEGISRPVINATAVFANKKSVRQSEHYQAAAAGRKPNIMFEVRSIEFDDHVKVRSEGKMYTIIRTFSKNQEITELICEGEVVDGG